jgi:hypothetical protein
MPNALSGYFATTAGDFNGDGLKDVYIGAPGVWLPGRVSCGAVYVIFGSRSFNSTYLSLGTIKSGSAGFRVYGSNTDGLGVQSGGGGDINNDGYDDVLAGAGYTSSNAGATWVFFGHSGNAFPFVDIDLQNGLAANYGFRILGAASSNSLIPGAIIGDMNGDGIDDFVLGAQLATNVASRDGTCYVIFGKSGFTSFNIGSYTLGTNQGFKMTGNLNNHQLCQGAGAVGDFNGDGYADVFFFAYNGGYSYIVPGHSAATNFPNIAQGSWVTSATTGFKITGVVGTSGPPVDINGDGIQDLILANGGFGGGAGITYVVFGHRTGTFPDITISTHVTASTGFTITGATGDGAGASYIGDINKDGYPDFGIAAATADPFGRTNAGAAYIYYGKSTFANVALSSFTTSEANGYRIYGAAAGDVWGGFGLARVGDINGDGVDDAVYQSGKRDCYGGGSDCGTVYILLSASRTPTSQPSSQPSRLPSRQPTSQPASDPTSQPSSQPSIEPATVLTIRSSPSYMVRNGFAFAVVTADGKGLSWGEVAYGGDSSAVQSALQSGVTAIVGSRFAFAAIKADRSLQLWGANVSFDGPAVFRNGTYQVSTLIANEAAFAVVDSVTGKVIAVGSKHHGGNVLDDAYCNGYSAQLSAGVRSITATSSAFAAIKTDGTLLAWGNLFGGTDVSAGFLATLSGAKMVVATTAAFAVLLPNNRVAAWGDVWVGGDTTPVANQLREVHHLVASRSCFAAFKKDSSLVVWGYDEYGGDSSAVSAALSSHVVYVSHTATAMAAVKTDGTVAVWGAADGGGDTSVVQADLHGIVRVYGNKKAFAALSATGGVVAWGRTGYGGQIPAGKVSALSSGVVSIYHTDRAFAALKGDGSLVVWGQAGHGGEPSPAVEALLASGVHTVCANDVAFSAIKTDGSVVVWGHSTAAAVQGVLFTSASLTIPATCA